MAMVGQESEHAARPHELPTQRLLVQLLLIQPGNPLHHNITRHTSHTVRHDQRWTS